MVARTQVVMSNQEQRRDALLRRALAGNVVFSLVTGVSMIAASGWISEFTGLSPAWIPVAIGAGVLLWALDVALIARTDALRPSRVWFVIIGDVAWVAASYAILVTGTPELSTAGAWTVGILAEIVALFAVVQYIGLRRMRS